MFKIFKKIMEWGVKLVFFITGIFFIRKWYKINNPLDQNGGIDEVLEQNEDEFKEKKEKIDTIIDQKDEDLYKEGVETNPI